MVVEMNREMGSVAVKRGPTKSALGTSDDEPLKTFTFDTVFPPKYAYAGCLHALHSF